MGGASWHASWRNLSTPPNERAGVSLLGPSSPESPSPRALTAAPCQKLAPQSGRQRRRWGVGEDALDGASETVGLKETLCIRVGTAGPWARIARGFRLREIS